MKIEIVNDFKHIFPFKKKKSHGTSIKARDFIF